MLASIVSLSRLSAHTQVIQFLVTSIAIVNDMVCINLQINSTYVYGIYAHTRIFMCSEFLLKCHHFYLSFLSSNQFGCLHDNDLDDPLNDFMYLSTCIHRLV